LHELVYGASFPNRERAVFSTQAHVFQIDQETKKKWLPSSSSAVKVAYYHDPAKKTYRVIAIDNSKVVVRKRVEGGWNMQY
jgi:homer protein